MTNYLCLSRGKDVSTSLIIGGVDIVSDLGRLWLDCLVYLNGTVHRIIGVLEYKDTPVFVLQPLGGDGRELLCSPDHPKLTIRYPDLGYFNTPTSVVYLDRTIGRQWKQGLHRNTCSIDVPFAEELRNVTMVDHFSFAGVGYQTQLTFSNFIGTLDLFNPSYPMYSVAVSRLLRGKALSVGLSRDIALALHPVNGEVHVLYHELSVGAVDIDNSTLVVRDEYFWLKDTLNEVIIL